MGLAFHLLCLKQPPLPLLLLGYGKPLPFFYLKYSKYGHFENKQNIKQLPIEIMHWKASVTGNFVEALPGIHCSLHHVVVPIDIII